MGTWGQGTERRKEKMKGRHGDEEETGDSDRVRVPALLQGCAGEIAPPCLFLAFRTP
jgi:hypothetical protein